MPKASGWDIFREQMGEDWDLNAMDTELAERLCAHTEMEDFKYEKSTRVDSAEQDSDSKPGGKKGSGTSPASSTQRARSKSSSTSPRMKKCLDKYVMKLKNPSETWQNVAIDSSLRITLGLELLLRVTTCSSTSPITYSEQQPRQQGDPRKGSAPEPRR